MKLSDLKAGMKVQLDDGFTCIEAGEVEVKENAQGLYFDCREGEHYFAGQECEHGYLIGVSEVRS